MILERLWVQLWLSWWYGRWWKENRPNVVRITQPRNHPKIDVVTCNTNCHAYDKHKTLLTWSYHGLGHSARSSSRKTVGVFRANFIATGKNLRFLRGNLKKHFHARILFPAIETPGGEKRFASSFLRQCICTALSRWIDLLRPRTVFLAAEMTKAFSNSEYPL